MLRQKTNENNQGILYLVATPIGNLEEMTPRAIRVLKEVDVIAAEDTRNTQKLLTHFDIHTKLIAHHAHNTKNSVPGIIALLQEGKNIALVSDAGYPAISDPGYELCQAAMKQGFPITPISGANAALDALIVSGIAPQPFLFYGFLSAKTSMKKKQLVSLKDKTETIVLYEAPHRLKETLQLLNEIFGPRQMALCRELTKRHEEIIRGTIDELAAIQEELKGEMVLVIEGHQPPKNLPSKQDIIAQMNIQKENHSLKDSAKIVAEQLHLKKNDVYRLYLEYQKEKAL